MPVSHDVHFLFSLPQSGLVRVSSSKIMYGQRLYNLCLYRVGGQRRGRKLGTQEGGGLTNIRAYPPAIEKFSIFVGIGNKDY